MSGLSGLNVNAESVEIIFLSLMRKMRRTNALAGVPSRPYARKKTYNITK